ncbi:cupredoxin domain-containing protein [Kushneria phyllosphaerae]|uniref:Plastocyanin n=1 Tax=Kushneria phyllosphaerae TaxID=2100822 RepID=A0A2R8CIM4_9GAMM|nr:plastocyanin/azurin family copper-binding protein [Kushneria phyllosphaerae]SPJ32757.1 Plastocyanin [Kushneria phyllosphaerae]
MKALLVTGLLIITSPVLADTGHDHASSSSAASEAPAVARTIDIKAGSMWFDPDQLQVAPGTTVRFRIENVAMIPHEFSIGSASMQQHHREMMQQQGGHHGEGNQGDGHDNMMSSSVTIEPGATQTLIWTAPTHGDRIEYACFIPGHYEAGMKGTVMLTASP